MLSIGYRGAHVSSADDQLSVDNLPAPVDPDGAGTWLETFSNLKNFLKVPGAVKAISRLVTGVGNAGGAWLEVLEAKGEAWSSDIRGETEARKEVRRALIVAAKGAAVSDPEIVDRAMRRFASNEIRKQSNIEAIAHAAAEDLNNDPPVAEVEPPHEDWIAQFQLHAERMSSEEFRDLWGRIYAAEIRNPGKISPRTLQFLSTLDKAAIALVERSLPLVLNGDFIPRNTAKQLGLSVADMVELEGLGFIQGSTGHMNMNFEVGSKGLLFLYQRPQAIALRFDGPRKFGMPAYSLTAPAREVAKIIKVESRLMEVAATLWEINPLEIVVGTVVEGNGSTTLMNLTGVPRAD